MQSFNRYKSIYLGVSVLTIFIIIIIVVFSLFYKSYDKRILEIRKSALDEFTREYSITIDIYEEMANYLYNTVINTPEVVNLFYKGVNEFDPLIQDKLREELYNYIKPMYDEIVKYNFRQLHFHTSENLSYLRMHRPSKYGDDLTNIRSSVVYVNRENKSISGFEEGRIYNGYRFLYPLIKDDKHIGSVEISTSTLSIVSLLNQNFGFPSEFLLDKNVVDSKVFESEQGNYKPWSIDNRFVLDCEIANVFPNPIKYNKLLANKITKSLDLINPTPFSIYYNQWSNNSILLILPIFNFENNVVAYLVSYRDFIELEINRNDFLLISIILFILIVVMLFFAFYYYHSQKRIKNLADMDFLTGTYMRRILFEQLEQFIDRFLRYNSSFSAVMLDVDFFKRVNDNYGHEWGDFVLKEITSLVNCRTRKSDILGRYGGEEFIILLPETKIDEAILVAEDIRTSVEQLKIEKVGRVTISCGVEEYTDKFKDSLAFIDSMDNKLYKAKESGRNRVVY